MTHVVAQCKLNIHQHQRTLASMMPAATSPGLSAESVDKDAHKGASRENAYRKSFLTQQQTPPFQVLPMKTIAPRATTLPPSLNFL